MAGADGQTSDDELARRVAEAVAAAQAAQQAAQAAERAAREQPPRWEQLLETFARILATLSDGIVRRVRDQVESVRRSGEELVARALLALANALRHAGGALAWMMVAALLVAVAVVTLAVGLVEVANDAFGAPWGTLAVGALLLALGVGAALAARNRTRRIVDEARMVAPRLR